MKSTKYLFHLAQISFLVLCTSFSAWSQFSPIIPLTSGEASGTSYVVSADIDNDGDMDILFNSPQRIAWYENYDNGLFLPKKTITNTLQQARQCVVADMNNDGFKDVVTVAGSNLGWYKNNGNKTFGSLIAMPGSYSYLSALAVGDIDNDNDNDVMATTATGSLYKLTNNGIGTFTYSSMSSLSGGPSSVMLADIDLDGDKDMLITTTDISTQSSNQIRLFKNNGTGTFANPVSVTPNTNGTQCTAVADLDGDGLPDLMSASRLDDKIAWYKNIGGGTFGPQQVLTEDANGARYVNYADMDEDGDLDVIGTAYDDGILFWFPNLGGGTFGTMQIINQLIPQATNMITADLDNDGKAEVIVSSDDSFRKVLSFPNMGGGNYGNPQLITVVPFGYRMVSMDYDQDGLMDYFMSDANNNQGLWFVKNLGNGKLSNPVLFAEIAWLYNLMVLDHDHDGDLDLLYTTSSSIGWFENLNGTFSGPQSLVSSLLSALSCTMLDVNNDGEKDMLMASNAENKIALHLRQGNGFLNAQIINSTLTDVDCLTAMDVDNDGFEDLVMISYYELKWMPNLGNGTFGPPASFPMANGNMEIIRAADVNNDGLQDLISSSSAGKIYKQINTGNGVFEAPVQLNAAAVYESSDLILDDSDQDGDLDIYAFSDWMDADYWLENTGGGAFAQPVTMNIASEGNGFSMCHALVEDMDGDGDKDIVVSNGDNDMYWIKNYLFNSGQVKGKLFVDKNANGIYDSTDVGVRLHNVVADPQSDFTFTYSNGNYFMIFSDVNGTYEISPQPIPYWTLSSDSTSYHITLNPATAPQDSLDFGFVPGTVIHVVDPQLVGGFPRCNTVINYWLNIENTGTTIPSGVVHLELDSNLVYIGAQQLPDSIVGNNIYWHYDSLSYFSSEQWQVSAQVSDFQSMGNVMTSKLTAYVYDSTDVLSIFFIDSIKQTVVCAYDPNDKVVEPKGFGPQGLIGMETEWLDYTVRFQNTGNDTAMTVRITDQLDPSFDWSTLEILATSDPLTVNGNQDGLVTFEFKNIYLPDSNANELASHGFIHYRLRLKENLSPGTQVHNLASIYFDLNPAVITNETVNTLYECPAGAIEYTLTPVTSCGDNLVGTVTATEPHTQYNWTIDGVTQAGTTFNWTATSGTHELELVATDSMGICAEKQASQTITIEIPLVMIDTLTACNGESISIFGMEQTEAGIYYDTLQTAAACDSIVGIKLELTTTVAELQEFAQDTICQQASAVSLPSGTPSGGTYTGSGVNGNTFDPAMAGSGTHYIVYRYTGTNDCIAADSVAITVQVCLGLEELTGAEISVYPNPLKDVFRISFPTDPAGEYDLVIFNLLGEKVYTKDMLSGNPQVIELRNMDAGAYFLNLIHRESGTRIIKPLILE